MKFLFCYLEKVQCVKAKLTLHHVLKRVISDCEVEVMITGSNPMNRHEMCVCFAYLLLL